MELMSSSDPPIIRADSPSDEEEEGASYYKLKEEQENADDHKKSSLFDPFFGYCTSLPNYQKEYYTTGMWIGIAAILGALSRIMLAQIFGEHCANPGTVGWLAASSPLCVTKTGESTLEGGIVFADLPANLLGSFIMGMMQSGSVLGLPMDVKVAWISLNSWFQNWTILHLAIKTGFCGSLTTFSSWNAEMVVMMFGTGTLNLKSDIWRAIFGYIIGMETAMGSFVLGQRVAFWIHRYLNPDLAEEMDAIYERSQEGVYINPDLPELERRFLPDLRMDVPERQGLEYLERWRESTYDARRNGHGLLQHLLEMETTTLINGTNMIPPETESVARSAGWDVNALLEWIRINPRDSKDHVPQEIQHPLFLSFEATCVIFGVIMILLLLGLLLINDPSAYSVTYRTMVYGACLAPLGALLRWKLSFYNGQLDSAIWHWLPVGTLVANVLGSIVSIAMVAAELKMETGNGFWAVGTVRAIKVGFCGCLTTVSTFVSEVSAFMKISPQQYRAYIYILVSLGVSSIAGGLVFAIIVYW